MFRLPKYPHISPSSLVTAVTSSGSECSGLLPTPSRLVPAELILPRPQASHNPPSLVVSPSIPVRFCAQSQPQRVVPTPYNPNQYMYRPRACPVSLSVCYALIDVLRFVCLSRPPHCPLTHCNERIQPNISVALSSHRFPHAVTLENHACLPRSPAHV